LRRIRDWPLAARVAAAAVPVALVVLVLQVTGSDDRSPTRPTGSTTTLSRVAGLEPAPTDTTAAPPGQPDVSAPEAGAMTPEQATPGPTIGAGSVPPLEGAPTPTLAARPLPTLAFGGAEGG
jgi:hypothetical protein